VNQLEASMSYLERTARKLYPILTELKRRMIPEKQHPSFDERDNEIVVDLDDAKKQVGKNQAIDLKNILGYLN
jgi:hypothetical protein